MNDGGRVHLTGKKLRDLNERIFERDNHSCIVCGRWVAEGTKFHHEPIGPNKSDEIEKGVVLCEQCHYDRHCSKNSQDIKRQVKEYLGEMYSDAGGRV